MVKYKKMLVSSILVGSFVLNSINIDQVSAATYDHKQIKIGESRDYQEIVGPHLIVNVTGVDKNGNDKLHPKFMEFHIKPGQVLNKKEITKYVEWTLDGTAYNKYRVVDFAQGSKVEVTYFSKTEKRNVTQSFPITDKGFVVPDLSEHTTNPGYTLVTNVIIEEKKSKK
ncbi:staphylokinase domain-containing protein [Mammaliicoccus sciuri]|uniref:staphylokinase domain-containing protein n=1 Tax=Mammaliicoccus sciuri TaxID=1296 RepID=UPI000879187C|nr:staphylokinase domain-containing protein [Mammaliicoccus sciuri]AQN32227.1 staphylokinase [Staphylococcus phage phi575]OFV61088.1 kinase [Mammaliicoccus sciuri]